MLYILYKNAKGEAMKQTITIKQLNDWSLETMRAIHFKWKGQTLTFSSPPLMLDQRFVGELE